ncbi:MAG: hypothetical protein IIB28_02250, partial [Chloroflexi bacterium]|nr:hypothetical protein [Chloroflexota bacterium]
GAGRTGDATDLAEGDFVAVSLELEDGELVADVVQLIPGKTRFRHLPGTVTAVSAGSITIQPPNPNADPITLGIDAAGTDLFLEDGQVIAEGDFVIIVATRDPETGEIRGTARAIHVKRQAEEPEPLDESDPIDEPENEVKLRGVFEGIDEAGNWIIDGFPVSLDKRTKIDGAIVAGQVVELEGVLKDDGTLVAREIELEEDENDGPNTSRINGIFEGVDADGNWIISGISVEITDSTDTDGLPFVGQRVKVKALVLDDGSIVAREVENKGGKQDDGDEVKIRGLFQGVDADGNWIVDGHPIAVNALTRLEGAPGQGQRVEVKALRQANGTLIATKIEGDDEGDGPGRFRAEAKIKGVITEIRANSIVVDGREIALSVLTELETTLEVGARIEVKALLQSDGSLVAEEVEQDEDDGDGRGRGRTKVEIEGVIDSISEDGSTLVVNGITVARSALSDVRGNLVAGSTVKIEGVIRPDGTILAAEIKGEGRRSSGSNSETRVRGVLETINRDEDGNVTSVVVNGLEIPVDVLTRHDIDLEEGGNIEVRGIISDGVFIAGRIKDQKSRNRNQRGKETDEDDESDRPDEDESELKIEGLITGVRTDESGRVVGITVNGVDIDVSGADIEGDLEVGTVVKIEGDLENGAIRPREVEAEKSDGDRSGKRDERSFRGVIENVVRDADGNIVGLVINGRTISVDPLTRIRADLRPGIQIKLDGLITGGKFVAFDVKDDDDELDAEDADETEAAFRGLTPLDGDEEDISDSDDDLDDIDKSDDERSSSGSGSGSSDSGGDDSGKDDTEDDESDSSGSGSGGSGSG